MTPPSVPTCAVAPRGASPLARARAWLACRPCAAGWVVYLALAALAVAHFGGR